MLRENPVDLERVHFLGKVPYATYKNVLQISAVHVYLTYPFVLSWSLLEAMASGCLIVASDTAPVREVINDGENGLLVGFFDTDSIAERVLSALDAPQRFGELRREVVTTTYRYSIDTGNVRYMKVLAEDLYRYILKLNCDFVSGCKFIKASL
ncbi:glycosyltransferase [Aeromonas veronii]